MRKSFILSILFFLSIISVSFAQDKGFGIGVLFGEPTGVSGKLWLGGTNALDMSAAWSFKGDGNLLLQADYVWHSFNLLSVSSGKLPLYFGIGGRIIFAKNDINLGVRLPIGLDYMFSEAPVDIFLEIVPILDLTPSTDFDIGGGIGVRYWF